MVLYDFDGIDRLILRLSALQGESVLHGGDEKLVRQADTKLGINVDYLGYLPMDRLFARYRACAVNTYIRPGTTFHHKAVETLAANRPVVSFPGEFEETGRIGPRAGGELLTTGSNRELAETLSGLHRRWSEGHLLRGSVDCAEFT